MSRSKSHGQGAEPSSVGETDLPVPPHCPCCTQNWRLVWKVVNGTGERVLICEECGASWKEADEVVCGNAKLIHEQIDAKGRSMGLYELFDVDDPPPMPGIRTMSNRARKRRRL